MNELSTDVLVVGAGVSGIAAAVAAAEEGAKVILLDKNETPGGNAIHSNVGTICGAYYAKKENQEFQPVSHPFVQRVLAGINARPMLYHQDLVVVPYQVDLLSRYLSGLIEESGVEYHPNSEVIGVKRVGTALNQVVMKQNGEQRTVGAKAFVDCSGHGVLSDLAGLDMLKSEQYQKASQVFRVDRVGTRDEFSANFAIRKAILGAESRIKHISVVPGSLAGGYADIKFTLPVVVTDDMDLKGLNELGKELVTEVIELLMKNVESFCEAKLERIYPEVGVRVLKRPKGKYVLTEEDVRSGRKSDEQTKIEGTWPIEEWIKEERVSLTPIDLGSSYEIPLDCLRSSHAENLFFGGKGISATDRAIASARVIGTCLQTGFMAGKLAALK